MSILATFLVAAAVTYALRSGVTVIGRPVPEGIDRIAGLVTPAILASMVSSSLLLHGPGRDIEFPSPAVVAAVVCAFVVVRLRRNVALGLAAGFPAFWLGSLLGVAW
ncbi:MAG: AzlD domain-containing protein [Acidimicrobiia bacterium]|nr:AzlD domain-containing protein [Acidimicrobiia bacterium]MDH5314640.1 AzlD domain-containing protein [Actinomycetota bacterium]